MIGILTAVVSWALGVIQTMGYPGIAIIVGLESTGLPLPGETTLLGASYLASTGRFSLPLVIGSAALGAILGDSLGYLIGYKGGRKLLERYGRWVGITPEKLGQADRYFERHGAKTVFFGRFIAVLRVLAGPLAGASRMPYRRFLLANVTGSITWASTMGVLAYFFGKPVAHLLSAMGIWALVAISVFFLLRFSLKSWKRHREKRLSRRLAGYETDAPSTQAAPEREESPDGRTLPRSGVSPE
ncbi:MAG: DedA family protein [Rubrobacteraceae bacterium]|nr:DedA family protein [Rubrobacteraceae bacterium]MCL6438896.1 DedA family protein [Rubrobacteraceae bacterium]